MNQEISLTEKIEIPQILKEMNGFFERNGLEAYLVGGAVRDVLLGRKNDDLDIATNATPEQVQSIFRKTVPTGIKHGTITVFFKGEQIEVTTFRTESSYSDGRHPDAVEYCKNIKDDLSRRDFTINAIAANLKDGSIVDPFEGRRDLKNKIIRTVGMPHDRFMEDGLRPVRAIRFATKLNFCIENNTYSEIFKDEILKKVAGISVERFREELCKILQSEKPSTALKMLEETSIMKIFIPELCRCRGIVQHDYRGFHDFDVLDHIFAVVDGSPKNKLNVRVAALFHDIGKPQVRFDKETEKGIKHTFHGHERQSCAVTKKIMKRLKFSNAEIENCCHLIENHMLDIDAEMNDSRIRKFLVRVGSENIEDLFDLMIADSYGKKGQMPQIELAGSLHWTDSLNCLKLKIDRIIENNDCLCLKDLKINGNDLIELGIKPGKQIGEILDNLLMRVLNNPELNEKKQLQKIALQLLNDSGK